MRAADPNWTVPMKNRPTLLFLAVLSFFQSAAAWAAITISYSGRLKTSVQPSAVRYHFVLWARKSGAALDDKVGEGREGVRVMLHPAGQGIVFGFDEKGEFSGAVTTTEVGPGYHQAVVRVLEDFQKRFAEKMTVRDSSEYWQSRDRFALERQMLEEMRRLLEKALSKWPRGSSGRLVTPMGQLDRSSVEAWRDDMRFARDPELRFPWWNAEKDAAYWNNLACTIYFGRFMQGKPPRDQRRILRTLESYFDRGRGAETWLSHFYRGRVELQRGRLDAAEAWLHAALKLNPDQPDLLLTYGDILLEGDEPKRAEAIFRLLAAVIPDSAEASMRLGLARSVQRDYAGALSALDDACRLDPKSAAAWSERGLVLRELDRPAESLSSLTKGLELDPRNEDTLYNMGVTLLRMNRLDEAEKRLQECLKLNAQHYDALVELGNVQVAREDLKSAAATYYRASRYEPKRWEAFYNLGRVYERMGRQSEAKNALRKAERLGAPREEER